MKTTVYKSIACIAVFSVAVAATPDTENRLTAQRIAELTAPKNGPTPKRYTVTISDIASLTLRAANPGIKMEHVRELIFPNEFALPKASANGTPAVTPIEPVAFETIHTGWTIHLTAKPQGKLVTVYGVADYVEAEPVPGGYGEIAGPIYNEQGAVITPNKLEQPRVQTTTTRFHLFAVPGESYEVTLYRGAKSEKHIVTVEAK